MRARGSRDRVVSLRKEGLSIALVMLAACALSASLATAAPIHPPLATGLDGSGTPAGEFDKACGVAVDSQGDIYVASAGKSSIEVFDAGHAYLTTIEDALVGEPCGLAVDGKGQLYVSDAATGNVFRYLPDEYPFVGTPTYGSPVAIDESGEARGISVDPADDRLYVARGDHIAVYDSKGVFGVNEVQAVRTTTSTTGGTYVLSFKGQDTAPIPYNATHAEVETALDGLSTISGDVAVTEGNPFFEGRQHRIEFVGALARTDVEQIKCDGSNLVGSTQCIVETEVNGFSGEVGEGALTDAMGIAAYTYAPGAGAKRHYLFAADTATDEVKIFSGTDVRKLKITGSVDGKSVPDSAACPNCSEGFGFGPAGAYLAADKGTCPPSGQACTAGHFFVYDDAHKVLDEFEASGQFLDQVDLVEADPGFADAQPTAVAIDRSGGAGDGTLYVSTGAGPGAEVLAFGPLAPPSHSALTGLSEAMNWEGESKAVLKTATAVATDSFGNIYAAAGSIVHVFDPEGDELTTFEDAKGAYDMDVDSEGNVYVLDGAGAGQEATYYVPSSFPPTGATTYARHVPAVATPSDLGPTNNGMRGIAVNTDTDHVFITSGPRTIELGSAGEGSPILENEFGSGLGFNIAPKRIDVNSANGNVYFAGSGTIWVADPKGEEILAQFNGAGSPKGSLPSEPAIAVDDSNGHVVAFDSNSGTIQEYEASGTFVAQFGSLAKSAIIPYELAIDNGPASPNRGNVYLAFDDPAPDSFDLTAFSPLAYGEPPQAITGIASGLGGGNATLNGSVDPRGFPLEDCHFEWLTDAQYEENLEQSDPPFEGGTPAPCVPGIVEIGNGQGAVAVHADLTGLDPEGRYRFRLVATNEFGTDEGKAGLFGAPQVELEDAQPVLYDEATLRAQIDPSGLVTEYHFEYGTEGAFDESTPVKELPAGDGPVAVQAPLTGLQEGTEYEFRLLASNEMGPVQSAEGAFTTQERSSAPACPNTEFRTGLAANLPNCRAYELVTPAETGGAIPHAAETGSAGVGFNNWLTPPRGAGAGESLAYFIQGTLPGFEGNGHLDGYRAQRGEGEHPKEGWQSTVFSPTYAQSGGGGLQQRGVDAEQRYSFWNVNALEDLEGVLPAGLYLRTPAGTANTSCGAEPGGEFELVGCGAIGTDPDADGRFIAPGGSHVIFGSDVQLETEAAPDDTTSIYDRTAAGASAEVVSVKPDGSPFSADAAYLAATEDGTAVAFDVGGTLYLHRGGQTTEVSAATNTFAGISEDGGQVFYAAGPSGQAPASLFVFNLETQTATPIAEESIFVNVSADGSDVFFTSEKVLDGAEEGSDDVHNLYTWDAATTEIQLIGILDPADLVSFGGNNFMDLLRWSEAVTSGIGVGLGNSPTRSTPDGEVFVFQSHAQLTAYDNEGHGQVYRYDPAAAPGERLLCLSCDPGEGPASADAMLQTTLGSGVPSSSLARIPGIAADGQMAFFQSPDSLVPEDANSVQDVYEWRAQGVAGCEQAAGCLGLISSGQGENDNYLFAMSEDGHDVFFMTLEKLHGADVPGSPSIYDARIDGGIPDPPAKAPCQGDACQGQGSPQPALLSPASTAPTGDGNVAPAKAKKKPCPKGKHRVTRGKKTSCVAKKKKKGKGSGARANHDRRPSR